ncbi:MAG: hypothetical protein FWD18_05570 [Micrococcales bacterium]|nr:hypothetical protein [Micrococcales bacterium]
MRRTRNPGRSGGAALGWSVVIAAAAVLVLAACTDDGGSSAGGDDPTPTAWPQPTGEVLTVEPVDAIDGATRFESDGVSVLVPEGWETERREAQEPDLVQIFVISPDDRRTMVGITVGSTPGDADAVEGAATTLFAQSALGGATDMVQRPAQWSGWRYASAVTGAVEAGEIDFVAVTLLSKGQNVISVVARAPAGALDGSLADQVMRSLKDLG